MTITTKLAIGAALAVTVASPASAEKIFGLLPGNTIVTFDSAAPATIQSTGTISGIIAGETLIGLDLRPANRTLYTTSTAGTLYAISASGSTYTATVVGTLGTTPSGSQFGYDFNPVPDRLRIISTSDQNLRVNPNDAVTIVDGMITPTPLSLVGAAYSNNRAGAASTTLYAFDTTTDRLVRSTNANAGTYVTTSLAGNSFGAFGPAIGTRTPLGFDISGGTGTAFASVGNRFYTVNLTTGQGSLVGTVGGLVAPPLLIDITANAVPEPATWAMMIAGFGLVGVAMRRRSAVRTVAA